MALLDPGVQADAVVGPAVLEVRDRVLDVMRNFGATSEGALVYPVILNSAGHRETADIVDAALSAFKGAGDSR